jgi:ATP-binding cassette subfamily G (WHITE) protein 2 (SNQ2)
MIAAEFHGLQFACSLSSIIPNGPSYINAVFQSCAIPGSTPGSLNVDGDAYIAQKFGFYYSNVWRDFGILILFAVAFAIIACVLSEIFDWSNGGSGAIEYRKAPRNLSRKGRDEEEHGVECDSGSLPSLSSKEKMRKGVPSSKEVFTWRNLEYSIEYEGGRKVLLNKVSGYCRPGEMTALVGVSGAGKTTREFAALFYDFTKCR